MALSRRSLLRLAPAAAGAAMLTACRPPPPTAAPATPIPSPRPAAAPTAEATRPPTSPPTAVAPPTPAQPTLGLTDPSPPNALAAAPAATPKTALIGAGQRQVGWATPGNPDELRIYQTTADRFVQTNPGFAVKADRTASERDRLADLLAAGQPPDVIFATINDFPSWAVKRVFWPLDDYLRAAAFDLDDFYPQILKPYRTDGRRFGDGKLYGLPKEIAIRSMFYNADIFKEAGVREPDPKDPWSWDVFRENVLRTVKRDGDRTVRYGYVQETWWGPWAIFAWANGGEVVDDPWNPTRATMEDPRVVEALTYWSDFVVKDRAAPAPAVTQQQGKAEMFAGGLAATYNNGRWNVPLFRKSGFGWDVMPMPRRQQRAQLLTGSIFGIWSGSRVRDDAWQLLAFVSGKDAQRLMTELGLLLPSRRSVAESDVFLKSSPPSNNRVYIDELAFARILPMHPRYPEMEKVVGDQIGLVLAGAKRVPEAVKEMNGQVDALLRA